MNVLYFYIMTNMATFRFYGELNDFFPRNKRNLTLMLLHYLQQQQQ